MEDFVDVVLSELSNLVVQLILSFWIIEITHNFKGIMFKMIIKLYDITYAHSLS